MAAIVLREVRFQFSLNLLNPAQLLWVDYA